MKIDFIKSQICEIDEIYLDDLNKSIKQFEKIISKELKKYDDISGLDDYKMKKCDYYILHELYSNTNKSKYKIHILLYFMYSFYKLDGICFDENRFPFKYFFKFIKDNNNIHSLILKLVTDYE